MSSYLSSFLHLLEVVDVILWNYLGLVVILLAGLILSIKSKFFQFRTLFRLVENIKDLKLCIDSNTRGTHPLKLYFASVGGMIGLGNMVTASSAITIGGPGSLVWLWIASFIGMLVKYSEIYLGIKYRVKNNSGSYDGGPMYYLNNAFKTSIVPIIFCLLLCVYGVEVSQFLIITDTIVMTFDVNRYAVISILLFLVLISAVGGVKRLVSLCAVVMPVFIISYVGACLVVILSNAGALPALFRDIFTSAFQGHAAIGAFAGSTWLLSAHYGVSRAVYSGDIGIGYDAIIQSETQTVHPHKQARMAVYALFTDTMICTLTCLTIMVTGVWTESLLPSQYIIHSLAKYIPHVQYVMAILFFIAGFTTIVAYLVVGRKAATYLNPRYGQLIYLAYAVLAYCVFSFQDQAKVILVMSVSGGIIMILNITGVILLRKKVEFK